MIQILQVIKLIVVNKSDDYLINYSSSDMIVNIDIELWVIKKLIFLEHRANIHSIVVLLEESNFLN
jgi:hypothetical protein